MLEKQNDQKQALVEVTKQKRLKNNIQESDFLSFYKVKKNFIYNFDFKKKFGTPFKDKLFFQRIKLSILIKFLGY